MHHFNARRVAALCLTAGLLGSSLAAAYTVRPGDTLYTIAGRFKTTVSELQRLNRIEDVNALRAGQVLEIPAPPPPIERRRTSGKTFSFTVPSATYPGDPVTVRVSGATGTPTITWDNEALVVARDGRDWVAVGREVLGAAPKTVRVAVTVGDETVATPLKLLADTSRGPTITLALSKTVLANLNDKNRAIEARVLNAVYARRTPVAWTEPFVVPVPPSSTSGFGSSRRYRAGEAAAYHYGEDLVRPAGDPVRATNDGTVVIAGTTYKIRGNLVAIDHGAGIISLYFHLSKFSVKIGQTVKRGQVIGRVGSTGLSTGPHLHWEMRVRGEATDPLKWVGKRWP